MHPSKETTTIPGSVIQNVESQSFTPSLSQTIVLINNNTSDCPLDIEQNYSKVTTKADDAEVPIHYWNNRISLPITTSKTNDKFSGLAARLCPLVVATLNIALFFYVGSKEKSPCFAALKVNNLLLHKEAANDWKAGWDCIWHCADSSWWKWDCGSRPLFWRWHLDYQVQI